MSALAVSGLEASIGSLDILRGVDLEVPFGELHALMGPNGSGKSTLCHVLAGKPDYTTTGSAKIGDDEMVGRAVDERAHAGLFETFQYPVELAGISLRELLSEMGSGDEFWTGVESAAESLDLVEFLDRPVNQGLSGGEKKRSEILQLMAASPRVAILDEIDSGLDIDAVRQVAAAIEALRSPDRGVLIITHYSRILQYLSVDRIHVMIAGRVVKSGGPELAGELEDGGYDELRKQFAS
ncbi:MAG: Fe-S cluster assembly ATPase SufC [Acidimicrobiia bacterium]|nr:Fe-S cluster assembly ATPase SufC [Acidimicrobiia bacterium]